MPYPNALLQATPRNALLGNVADFLAQSYSPQRTQQAQGVANFLALPQISRTLDRLSYGEPLTTGAGGIGGTTRFNNDALDAAMALAPTIGPAARLAGKGAMATGRFVAPKVGEMAESYLTKTGGILPAIEKNAAGKFDNSALMGEFDLRFDPRKLEQAKLQQMTTNVVPTQQAQAPSVSLADFEGRPFITSMSDRTAAGGNLVGINDVTFNRPVELRGGQGFMFDNPGQVWASAQAPVNAIMKGAGEIKAATGQNPLFLPWRMAPTGGDFAAMTGETMLSYADSAMNKTQKRMLDKAIKQYIPEWSGVSSPESVAQFRSAPDTVRKALKNMMDVDFRNQGGLNIGQARLAVADPAQLMAPDAGVMNVGEIYAGQPMVMQSGHPSYPRGVPGQGLGTLAENRNIFELMPEVARARGIIDPTNPGQTDIRALQMKPYAGVISNELLKRLGY
jgi:hypothetical protein